MFIQLIRHSTTKGNEEKRFVGRSDEELSERGIERARAAKGKFKNYNIIYSSPMKRCLQTAKILFDKEIKIIEDLREMDFGIFDGKTFDEIVKKKEYSDFGSSEEKMYFPQGENIKEFKKRCISAINEIMRKGEDCSVVCHGGVIMSIIEYISGGEIKFYDGISENVGGFLIEVIFDKDKPKLKSIIKI